MIGQTHFNGYQIRLLKDMPESFIERVCNEKFGGESAVQQISSGKYSRVFRFCYKERYLIYKRFLNRGPFEAFKALFRGNRAQRALKGDMILQANGFLSPHGIIIGQKGDHLFAVTESLDQALNLIEYTRALLSAPICREIILKKRKLAKKLGEIVGKLHAVGIRHGDLRWGNMLIHETNREGFLVYFLDNERTCKFKRIPNRARLKNLVQMNMVPLKGVTRTDRLRFFKAYLDQNPDLAGRKKRLLKQILKKTERRLAIRDLKYPQKREMHRSQH